MSKEWKPRTWEEAIDRDNMLTWLQSPKTTVFAIVDQMFAHPKYGQQFTELLDKHHYQVSRPASVRQLAIETVEGRADGP